ncbi:phenylalanine--tRNA ligase subunit beta [Patescibacteria group bacterium]|nr:phenylalanine--tRNA ligase subunit beta [Patescibacteria group bacterium]
MKISFDWLKRYVDIPSSLTADELGFKLTMSTVEVEEVFNLSKELKDIVVGKLLNVEKHPNADKLHVAQVNIGDKIIQLIFGQVVKLKKGDRLPVAVAPVTLPTGLTVKKSKIRGVDSHGMFCLNSELGISDEDKCTFFGDDVKPGTPITKAMTLAEGAVLDIENKSLTHRPDLWSHVGIAREVGAILGKKLKEPTLSQIDEGDEIDLKIEIVDKDACPRYIGVAVSGIKVAPSPDWMQKLLLAAGMRPINNIVDITNFIMLEMGQPLHAFDVEQVIGKKIVVKKATEGQIFTTLDGQKRKLTKDDLLIDDSRRAVAIAGVMGGENSEVKRGTKTIILESANFDAVSIRRTSTRLGLRTEASTRFEKALDPELAEKAAKRAVNLIQEIIPTAKVSSKFVDVNYAKKKKIIINLDLDRLNLVIGEEIPIAKIKQILTSLEFKVSGSGKTLKVEVPSFRAQRDVTIQEDLIEEVARIYGFNNIKVTLPKIQIERPKIDLEKELEKKVKNQLTGMGFDEVKNYSFIGPSQQSKFGYKENELIKLKSYFSEDQSLMRPSMVPNMLINVENNLRFFDDFKIFELGTVYKKNKLGEQASPKTSHYLPFQPKRLTGMIVQKRPQDLFFEVKGVVDSLMQALNLEVNYIENKHDWVKTGLGLKIMVNKKSLGYVYIFNQGVYSLKVEVGIFDIDFDQIAKINPKTKKYKAMPEYPAITRDLALVISSKVKWEDIKSEVTKVDKLIQDVGFLSFYPEKKSLAFSITFRSNSRTLESKEVDQIIEKIIQKLQEKFNVQLR